MWNWSILDCASTFSFEERIPFLDNVLFTSWITSLDLSNGLIDLTYCIVFKSILWQYDLLLFCMTNITFPVLCWTCSLVMEAITPLTVCTGILTWICFSNHWRDKLSWMHVPRFPFWHLNVYMVISTHFWNPFNEVGNEFCWFFFIVLQFWTSLLIRLGGHLLFQIVTKFTFLGRFLNPDNILFNRFSLLLHHLCLNWQRLTRLFTLSTT